MKNIFIPIFVLPTILGNIPGTVFRCAEKNKHDLRFVEERVETLINWFKGIYFVKTKNTTDGVMWFNSVYTIALKTKDEGYESYYSKL